MASQTTDPAEPSSNASRRMRRRRLQPRKIAMPLVLLLAALGLSISAGPAAGAVDCSEWYSPTGDNEVVQPATRATATETVSVRRAPDASSDCIRGNVQLTAGTAVEVHGHVENWTYIRNISSNDFGWVKRPAVGLGFDCSAWFVPVDGEVQSPITSATTTQSVSVKRAPANSAACDRGVTLSAGTNVEIRGYSAGYAFTRNPANNDYGWIEVSAISAVRTTPTTTPINAPKTVDVSVRYRGTTGTELIRVIPGGTVESTTTLARLSPDIRTANLTYELKPGVDALTSLEITYTNDAFLDGVDMNVFIDWVEIDGVRIQTEDPRVHSVGAWSRSNGCGEGFKELEWLSCDGAFTYPVPGSVDLGSGDTAMPVTTAPVTTVPHDDDEHGTATGVPTSARENLAMLQSTSARNSNHDNSRYQNTPSASLPTSRGDLVTSWQEYVAAGEVNTNSGHDPNADGFRVSCEFSHFAYDDPIVAPNQPGAAHLHMFFGNTDTNAFSTADSLLNSGSSTCNGQELNRTAYWVPAMIDAAGNLPIPDHALFYYKAHGPAVGVTKAYPDGMRLISSAAEATSQQDFKQWWFYRCYEPGKSVDNLTKYSEIPACDPGTQLELNVRFQTCWNGRDPSDYKANTAFSYWPTSGACPTSHDIHIPQLEYRIFFSDHEGSENWILSSDTNTSNGGVSLHADWFGGWNKAINDTWLKNCVNLDHQNCDEGLLRYWRGNGDVDALRLRPQYNPRGRISGETVLNDLCPHDDRFTGQVSVAFCGSNGDGHHH